MSIKEFTQGDRGIILAYLQFAIAFLQKICDDQTDGTQEERAAGTLLFGLESAQSYFTARGDGPVEENDQVHFAYAFAVANMLLLTQQRQLQEFLVAIEDLDKTGGEVNTNSAQVVELLSRLQNPT